MRRLAWVTDPHLNFVGLPRWESLIESLMAENIAAILISGDISEAEDVVWQLRRLVESVGKPVFFVLGNHDFYHGSIARVRQQVMAACQRQAKLIYLTASSARDLGNGWTLCGDDGWADGRIGDYYRSPVRMNDFQLIDELRGLDARSRLRVLRREGAASAMRLRKQLEAARRCSTRTIVVTHIPPFREACWYDGHHSNDDWAPFFTCYSIGWMLRRFCSRYPHHQVLVLCGHTHSSGRSKIADNLVVWTAAAEYGVPEIAAILDLSRFTYPANDWSYLTA